MSNSSDKLSASHRAMLIGAMAGGGASLAGQWRDHQNGTLATNDVAMNAAKSAIKAGAISGTSTYIAENMAGRPALSLFTILSVGAAGLYMIDQMSERKKHE
ncbi:magnetosome protein MamC [Moritella sp. 5]|uniref:magnetosome protein MamC n=1 Tax=Moritella sp. 5 TaxID=2746231 RepID=UPI001BA9CB76|nr:magnetosome protein MamC [Moritella sp. 5]QUM82656.1 magnetosome protein MamC [Moritella sp. 5]